MGMAQKCQPCCTRTSIQTNVDADGCIFSVRDRGILGKVVFCLFCFLVQACY